MRDDLPDSADAPSGLPADASNAPPVDAPSAPIVDAPPADAPPGAEAQEAAPIPDAPKDTSNASVGLGLLGAGLLLAGAWLEQRETEAMQRLLAVYARRPPVEPEPPPPQPVEPPPAVSRAVTARPQHVSHDWCWRFSRDTPQDVRVRLVPSCASRSQYIRVARCIPPQWGRELDARGVTFEILRWIAAPNDHGEIMRRYQDVLRGNQPLVRPAELKHASKVPPLPPRLLRSRPPKIIMGTAETMMCDPGPASDCRSPPPPPRCARPSRRRWEPKNPCVCGEGFPHDLPDIAALEQMLLEITGQVVKLPPSFDRVPRPDSTGSCRPQPSPCPRRRRQPEPPEEPSQVKRPGRHRVAGDHDWW